MHRRAVAFVTAAVIALAGCASISEKAMQDKGMQPMTETELKGFYFGQPREAVFTSAANMQNDVRINGDGTYVASWPGGNDVGKYRVNGNLYCTSIPVVESGRELCSRVYRLSPNEHVRFLTDGTYRGKLTFR